MIETRENTEERETPSSHLVVDLYNVDDFHPGISEMVRSVQIDKVVDALLHGVFEKGRKMVQRKTQAVGKKIDEVMK